MHDVLYKLQHFNSVYYYDSIQKFRRYDFTNCKNVNLKLAKNFKSFKRGTNIHSSDFRSIENYSHNIWISGLIQDPIFILQDYGNDSFKDSKWATHIFGSEFVPSVGITKKDIYFIDLNTVVYVGPHNLKIEQFNFYTKHHNDKRPFNVSFDRKTYMNIDLKWRNNIVDGKYELQFYIGMKK